MAFPRSKNVTLELLRGQQRKRPLPEANSSKGKVSKRPRHEKTIDEPPPPPQLNHPLKTSRKSLNFLEGSKVLAYVAEQSSIGLKLDLPGGRRGFVPPDEVGQTSLQGRYVLALVIAADEKHRAKSQMPLTILPSNINRHFTWPPTRNQSFPVRVKSVEEHGYSALLEVPEFDQTKRIFVKFASHSEHSTSPSLTPGAIRLVIVDSVKKESNLVVCVEEEFWGPRYLRNDQTLDVNVLLPGQLVECSVTNVAARSTESTSGKGLQPMTTSKHSATKLFSPARGVEVSFSQTISGFVPYVHLHNPLISLSEGVARIVEEGKDATITIHYPYLDKENWARAKKAASNKAKELARKSETEENSSDDIEIEGKRRGKGKTAKSCKEDELRKYQEVPKKARRIVAEHSLLARIISAMPAEDGTLQFQLSLLPQIVFMDHRNPYLARLTSLQPGTILESARVGFVDKTVGLQMFQATDSANDQVEAEDLKEWKVDFTKSVVLHCSKKRFSNDDSETKLLNVSVGQKINTRLISVNLFDATAATASSEQYMNAKFISPSEIKLGTLVKATVTKILPWGAFVNLNEFVVARCFKSQFTDTSRTEEVMKKLKEGDVKKFRVLMYDRAKGFLYLTAKKSLLNIASETVNTQLQTVEQWPINFISDCYVFAHKSNGIFVRGFGDFCGLVPFTDIWKTLSSSARRSEPLSDMEKQKILDLPQFRVGVSIRCRVARKIISSVDSSFRAGLSIDLDFEDAAEGNQNSSTNEQPSYFDLLNMPLKDRRNKSLKLPFPIEPLDETLCDRALEFIPVGTEIEGQILGLNKRHQSVTVAIWGPLLCTVHATELFDEPAPKYPLEAFNVGDCVKVRITGGAPEDIRSFSPTLLVLEGSLRSKEGSASLPRTVKDLVVGKSYVGIIRNSNLQGVFVCISPNVHVRVKRRELDADRLRKAEASGKRPNSDEAFQFAYPIGKRVKNLRIMSVSLSAGQAEGSLKSSELNTMLGIDDSSESLTFDSVQVGQALAGNVKRLETFGIFITLRPGFDVLCPLDEVNDNDRKIDLNVGDLVLVKILKKNEALKRITVGLKSSYFNDLEIKEVTEEVGHGSGCSEEEEERVEEEEEDEDAQELFEKVSASDESAPGSDKSAPGSDAEMSEKQEEVRRKAEGTGAKSGCHDAEMDLEGFLGDEGDADDFVGEMLRRGERKKGVPTASKMGEINEAEVRAIERRNAAGEWMENPTSVDDYERLILLKGKDAEAWIRYMAYYLELKDLSAARKIAWRGIESMTFEQQEERRKIWLAWLNAETEFGTVESLRDAISKAVEYNDAKGIYLHMMEILEAKGDFKLIDDISGRMLFKSKMVGKYTTCWVKYLITLYTRTEREEVNGRKKDLSTREQIEECLRLAKHRLAEKEKSEGILTLMVTSARLEFKFGQVEKARTQFLRILKDHKSRTDLWMVFFDAEMSHLTRRAKTVSPRPIPSQDIQNTRQSFRELAKIELKPSKMKPLFARWMDFEKQYGSSLTVTECQSAAEAYVASKIKAQ